MLRFIYHAVHREVVVDESYAPESLSREGFIHCSFAPSIHESVKLYMANLEEVDVVQLDVTKLEAKLLIEATPRGPMPHVFGPIAAAAVVARTPFLELPAKLPDVIDTDHASR